MGGSLQLLEDMRAEIKRLRPLRHFTSFWNKLQGRDHLREVMRVGFKWKLTYHQLEKRIVRDGIYEPERLEYFFTQSSTRLCDVFLDVGANIGLYSMFAVKMGLFEEVHAYEPSAGYFERLQWHLQANAIADKVHTYQTALADFCGKVHFSNEDLKRPGGTHIVSAKESGVEVDCATLDSLFDFHDRRLAVKMDVEGHEIAALHGAEKLFANNTVFLQVEVWSTNTINYLFSQGFKVVHYLGNDFYFGRGASDENA